MICLSDNTLMGHQINLKETCEPVEKKNDFHYIECFQFTRT